MNRTTTTVLTLLSLMALATPGCKRYTTRDDNPPGAAGGPGTNWENPPGAAGGPGASPDRRYDAPRYWDREDNPPGPEGRPGTDW